MLTPGYLQRLPDSAWRNSTHRPRRTFSPTWHGASTALICSFRPRSTREMERLEETGALRRDIISKLSGLTGKSRKEIAAIMQEAGGGRRSQLMRKIYQAGRVWSRKSELACGAGGAFRRTAKDGRPVPQPHKNNSQHGHTSVFQNALDRAYMQVTSLAATDPSTAVQERHQAPCAAGCRRDHLSERAR